MHRSALARWRHALKLGSWPKLLVPAVFGQATAYAHDGSFHVAAAAYVLAFTVLDIAFVVLLNDYGDRDVDAIKRRMFPDGCSPKTIPDGILPARHLLAAGAVAGLAALGVAVAAAAHLGRAHAPLFAALCLALFVAYTLPPIRLNYRGGGELLEALGVGVALPSFAAYLQSGDVLPGFAWLLPGYALLSLSSAVASGLSDEESDRRGGKRTLTTLLGNGVARDVVECSLVAGAVAWFVPLLAPGGSVSGWVSIPALAAMTIAFVRMRRTSPAAVTGAFAAQAEYKGALHGALWGGTLLLSAGLVLERWLWG